MSDITDVTNIITATFSDSRCVVTEPAVYVDHGMYLQFEGLDLPTAFECDFSNTEYYTDTAITMIGTNNKVQIPDELFLSGQSNIFAFVYLHPESGSGVTAYEATIPLLGRPQRADEEPTPAQQTAIEQAIEALNAAVEQTAEDVANAFASASEAAQSEVNAMSYANQASASAGAALASQNAAESAAQHVDEQIDVAAGYAENAAVSAAQAAQSATDAATSADRAEQAAADSGYMWFYIEDGQLFMDKTPNVDVDFYLENGKLYVTD